MNIKKQLYKLCEAFVNKRQQTVENIILSNQKALQSETKSSAGDKHETGRAMLQLEMEKAGQQLANINQMKDVLAKMIASKPSKIAHLGSVIITNKNNYFLSVSAGKLTVSKIDYFAISTNSPIGKLLLGKKENESIIWNGNEMIIEEIS